MRSVAALRIRHGWGLPAPMTPFASSSSFGVAKALRQRAGRLVHRTGSQEDVVSQLARTQAATSATGSIGVWRYVHLFVRLHQACYLDGPPALSVDAAGFDVVPNPGIVNEPVKPKNGLSPRPWRPGSSPAQAEVNLSDTHFWP